MNFVIADLHWGHDNIVRYCRRPVLSPEELEWVNAGIPFKLSLSTREKHHNLLVDSVNSAVGEGDTLWVVGDAGLEGSFEEFTKRIKCKDLMLIRGNHDSPGIEKYFRGVFDLFEIFVHDQWFVMCHYALKHWHRSHKGSIQIHGHDHTNKLDAPHELQINVCCDVGGFIPRSFLEIKQLMDKKRPAFEEWKKNAFKDKDQGGMKGGR